MTMPTFDVETLCDGFSNEDKDIIRGAFLKSGKLRASKPHKRVATFEQGCINYVWRMLCFDLVGHGKHACMPVTADWELSAGYDAQHGRIRYGEAGYEGYREGNKALRQRMDDLVKRFERNIPLEQQKGIVRWGRALGYIA